MTSYDVEWYHLLPAHVKEILRRLQNEGKVAYVVGGAVRDLWLGQKPKDFDLVSTATPEEIEGYFPKTLDVGRAFGIMIVVTEAGPVEIARFRTDGAYTDNRRPDEVVFAGPEEDSRRRDFTINGLFYDTQTQKVLDHVGGVDDLRAKRIRAVGEAKARFQEDALRMLRAVRFHAQLGHLGFTLDETLLPAIRQESARLANVSRERITQEMLRLLASPRPSAGLADLAQSKLWPIIFSAPDLADPKRLDRLHEIYEKHFGPPPESLALAALELWVPGLEIERSLILGKETKSRINETKKIAGRLADFFSLELAEQKNLLASSEFPAAWALASQDSGPALSALLKLRKEHAQKGTLNPPPLLTGADLLSLGLKPGPAVRSLLDEIRKKQLNEEILTLEEAKAFAKKSI